jgi:uncharacterized damage-inducible protein DinB
MCAVTVEELRLLAAYNRWANTRLQEAAAALSGEELQRDLRASFGSLEGTLIHILWGERGWLHFWQQGAFVRPPSPGEYPDFATLLSAWVRHDHAYGAYLLGLTQVQLEGPRTVDAVTYTLGELIQHALYHSTSHRGQVTLLLRQLGYEPPSTDYRDFLTETR